MVSLKPRMVLVLLLGLPTAALGQSPANYPLRDYPLDSLRWLSRQPTAPDTARVFFLSRLAVGTSQTNLPAAVRHGNEALALARRIGYVRGEMNCLRVLANFHTASGDFVQAMSFYQQGVALAKAHHKPEQLARLYMSMGGTATIAGDYDQSLKYLLLSYALLKQDQANPAPMRDSAIVFYNLGTVYSYLKRFDLARRYLHRSLALFRRVGQPQQVVNANLQLGLGYQQQLPRTGARLDSAGKYLRQALAINQRADDPLAVAQSLLTLAELYQLQHRYAATQQAAARSLDLARRVGSASIQAEAFSLLAQAAAATGDHRRAYALGAKAAALTDTILNVEKTKALAQLQVRHEVQAQALRIQLLTQRARAAAARAREQRQRQRGWIWVAGLLALGLVVGWRLYLRLRRSRALLAVANREIRGAVAEKEVLIQEIHHRVKNNLQLVSSLLGWQGSVLPDPALAEALASSQARIQSMALVHEFLYRADNLAQVRLDTYLTELLTSLHQSLTTPHRPIRLSTDLAPVVMAAKEATAFGLLVNELVTNAYKHAFCQRATGALHVSLAPCPAGFRLCVIDNGVGLPAAGPERPPQSLGLQLVGILARQLNATVRATASPPTGTRVEVSRC